MTLITTVNANLSGYVGYESNETSDPPQQQALTSIV